jgi:chemotaxis protein CheD
MDMKTIQINNRHFLYVGSLFARKGEHVVTTVLGSCVSVCLWDPVLKIGGINHYLLPLWNGEGLPTPKYGNIAITKLIDKMYTLGARKGSLQAKIFGGSSTNSNAVGLLNVSERNIMIAKDVLKDNGIPIISSDVGGNLGRKIIFHSNSGSVLVKKILYRANTSQHYR